MSGLALLGSMPEVKSAVRGQLGGALLEALREPDPETVAAVTGFLASALVQSGEELGLGALRRVTFAGPRGAGVVVVQGDAVTSARIEPAAALAAVEKILDAAGQE